MANWLGAPLGGGVTTATRAKDTDRRETCAVLDNALSDGELSGEEHRERVSKASNAVTLGDLKVLVSDLQGDNTPTRLRASRRPHRADGTDAQAVGNVLSYRLVIYPTYAVFDRPDPTDDRRVLAYDYRGGWGDPTAPGALSLSLHVSGDYGGARSPSPGTAPSRA